MGICRMGIRESTIIVLACPSCGSQNAHCDVTAGPTHTHTCADCTRTDLIIDDDEDEEE